MSHTVRNKHKIIARTNKIQGQINGLKKMLEEHQECSDILQQIAAIKGAVNGLMKEVIKEHLTEHIIDEKDEKKREEDLQIILKILDSYIK